jgi:regulator of protease activity HflC (stomatin/prohibitin superfamily)
MPGIGPYIVAAVFLLIIILIANSVRVVPQARAYIIERVGAYSATWGVGLHFKIPVLDKIENIVSLKEQVADFPPQPVITKDNVTMQIDTVLYFEITDPKLYTYGVMHPMTAIENLTATTLRNIIGDLELMRRSPPATSSTPRCALFLTRPPTPGVSRSTAWS